MGSRDSERRHQGSPGHAFRFSALIKPDGEVLQIDRHALAFWQLAEQDVNGKLLWDIGWRLVQDDAAPRLESAVRAAAEGRIVRREAAVWHHGGQRAALAFSLRPLRDQSGEVVLLVADVHNLKRGSQADAATQAARGATDTAGPDAQPSAAPAHLGRDRLTGLLNRRGLLAELDRTLESADTDDRRHTLCYIDLDGFEQVNHEIGTQVADEALRQVAQELRSHARHGDVVARLGGDDFVLLLRDCAVDNAGTVTEALLRGIHELRIGAREPAPQLSASAGLVSLQAQCGSHALIKAARRACLDGKEAGGNQIRVAAPPEASAEEPSPTPVDLFEQDRLGLFQQPLVALDGIADGAHAEVLLRVRGADEQWQLPRDFLSRAENNDLMPDVDRWVIRKVFAHARRQRADGPAGGYSINLSPASIADEALIEFIRAQRNDAALDPAAISFEISEPAALDDPQRARTLIDELHELGFKVTLDDCGKGDRSLDYLRELPVDYLKIDGELMRALVDDPVNNVMVDAINRIGHLTGKRTIGKCVENDATVERLRALRLDYAQGYGLAEPMRLESAPI